MLGMEYVSGGLGVALVASLGYNAVVVSSKNDTINFYKSEYTKASTEASKYKSMVRLHNAELNASKAKYDSAMSEFENWKANRPTKVVYRTKQGKTVYVDRNITGDCNDIVETISTIDYNSI